MIYLVKIRKVEIYLKINYMKKEPRRKSRDLFIKKNYMKKEPRR